MKIGSLDFAAMAESLGERGFGLVRVSVRIDVACEHFDGQRYQDAVQFDPRDHDEEAIEQLVQFWATGIETWRSR